MSIFARIHTPDDTWLELQAAESVLDPDRRIIDPQVHLWELNGHSYLSDAYARDIDASGHRVEASMYVECFMAYRTTGPEHLRCVGETEHAVRQAEAAGDPRVASGIIAYADLLRGESVREVLQAHRAVAGERFKGVRQRAKWDPDPQVRGTYCAQGPGLLLDSTFGQGIDVLASMGLVFDASVFHLQIPDVTALARAHPQASIVLIHCGSPVGHGAYAGRPAETRAQWMASMKALATCANVSIKLGGLLMSLGNYDFTATPRPLGSQEIADLWRPWVEPCIDMFGADRCMVSSNFPVDKAGLSYRTLWNSFKHITQHCSEDEKAKLFADTARRIYKF